MGIDTTVDEFGIGMNLQIATGPSRYLQLISKKAKILERRSTKRLGRLVQTGCNFCKNNGEPAKVYQSHVLKDSNEKVICPVLYAYVCPICNASGEESHTVSHCPNHPERLEQQRRLNEQWQQLINPRKDAGTFEEPKIPVYGDESTVWEELKPLGAYITNENVFTANILGILLTQIEPEPTLSQDQFFAM